VIGYRLRVHHLGAVLWVHETGAQQDQLTRFNRAVQAVAEKVGPGRSPLLIPRDRASAWAWIPVPDRFTLDLAAVRPLLDNADGPPLPMVAFGRAHTGLAGLRQTHLEAVQAQRVAMIRDDPTHPVTGFQEPGLHVAALLALDVDQTRWWVQETLGDLARDDEQHERLRETLLLFFRHDSSYTATAEAIVMHKNSVKYRIASAEKILGRSIGEDRQAIELALTACHWLGQAVLAES
jgi:DNA-binding PucR family transcriptional regulator